MIDITEIPDAQIDSVVTVDGASGENSVDNIAAANQTTNYEIVWEDDSADAADWVQNEFDFFWNHRAAVPLSDFVVGDIKRVANRHPLTLKGWREQEQPEVAAVAAEEPIYRNEFGLWAHQK